MSGFELRPLSLGELLDRAFLLYRRNFWLFASIMLLPAVLILPMQFVVLRNQGQPFPWSRPMAQSQTPPYTFIFLLAYWFIYAVVQAATTFAVSDTYLGRATTVREAYGKVRGRFWRVIGVTLGVGIRVFALMFLFVVVAAIIGVALTTALGRGGGATRAVAALFSLGLMLGGVVLALWLGVRYAVSIPAMLLENSKGRAAIHRSVDLSRGRRGQAFVAILLGLVVTYAMAFLFQGPFYAGIALAKMNGELPTWLILAMSASSTIGGVVAGPLLMIILVIFYYDLRIRKEAFDLQQMMASLPEANPTGAAPLA
jgi:hypothetical protein